MSSWRAPTAAAIILAIAGATAVAQAEPPATRSAPIVTVTPLAPARTLPPEGPAPPAAGHGTTQSVSVTISGGDLELEADAATIVLHRVGEGKKWTGDLPAVRVVDARGVPDGWEVRWRLDSLEVDGVAIDGRRGVKVAVAPNAPTVICCGQDSVYAGASLPANRNGRPLFGAETGTGGGTFEVDAAVSAQLPRSIDATTVVVHLSFAFR